MMLNCHEQSPHVIVKPTSENPDEKGRPNTEGVGQEDGLNDVVHVLVLINGHQVIARRLFNRISDKVKSLRLDK